MKDPEAERMGRSPQPTRGNLAAEHQLHSRPTGSTSAEPYLVISADTHAGLPGPEYRDWLDPEYRERFDTFLVERARAAEMAKAGFLNEEFAKEWQEENEEGLRGGWDAARRDKELDADGVAGEVIFPDADAVTGGASAPFGAGLGATGDTPGELLLAGARAHNRWLAELCHDSPERRAGVAVVPIIVDVEEAVAEIRRAHASGLRGGILIPPMWQPHEPYHHPRYDPVWRACEELGLPVHVHSGVADRAAYGPHVGIFTTETRFWSSRPLWFLIWSGVFERFPGLRFGVAECGAFWVNDLLWRMDLVYDRDHGSRKLGSQLNAQMTMRPSEYFDRNCFIGASNIVRVEMARRYEIGVPNLCWGNDFPHPEGTWPHTREFLAAVFRDIPRDETAAMLGMNAAEVYGFDVEALRPLVDRIGPTPAELGQDHDPTAKWADAKRAGRPWLTGVETWPTATAPGPG